MIWFVVSRLFVGSAIAQKMVWYAVLSLFVNGAIAQPIGGGGAMF